MDNSGASDSAIEQHPGQRSLAHVAWSMTATSQASTKTLDTYYNGFNRQPKMNIL